MTCNKISYCENKEDEITLHEAFKNVTFSQSQCYIVCRYS